MKQLKVKVEKHLHTLTHNGFDKCIQTKLKYESPDFFDKKKVFIGYITIDNKNYVLYPVKNDFNLVKHNEFYPQRKI